MFMVKSLGVKSLLLQVWIGLKRIPGVVKTSWVPDMRQLIELTGPAKRIQRRSCGGPCFGVRHQAIVEITHRADFAIDATPDPRDVIS